MNPDGLAHKIAVLDRRARRSSRRSCASQAAHIEVRESELRASTAEEVFDTVVLVNDLRRREPNGNLVDIDELLHASVETMSRQMGVYYLAYIVTVEKVV